jgi:uncharacterized protein YggE
MKRFLPLFITLVAVGALAQTQTPSIVPSGETISVTGTGRANVTPDRVTFTVGVQTVADTVEKAVNENNARVAAVVAALKKEGAKDSEVRTANFSIFPQQDYSQGRLPRILGYQVSNNVTVTRDKVADAGRLLQAAVNAGVNTSSGLQFEVADPNKGRDQGLKAAYDDARTKATLLAQAAGRSLGRAVTISEGAAQQPIPPHIPVSWP